MLTIREADDLYDIEDEDDYGFGYTLDGDAITESDIEELYRIANSEILPNTELGELGDADIDEDTFEYVSTGTAFGAAISYDIILTIGDGAFDLDRRYALPDSGLHPSFQYGDNSAEITFTIHVNEDSCETELSDASITNKGYYSDRYSDNFGDYWDVDALCDAVNKIAEKAAYEIHATLSNF